MARVLLFGPLRDLAGWREKEFDASSLSSLKAGLAALDPDLGAALSGPGVQAAVDKTVTRGDASLSPATEVAFLPPMSGG